MSAARRRLRVARRCAALGLVCSGALLLAQGFWIPAKAALAQRLLERAWTRSQAAAEPTVPWPWADTWPVARLRAPAHGVEQIVLEGATGRTLAFGPGRLAGSALPGEPGHSVLAGHRDTHFAFLRELAPGDLLQVERRDGVVTHYRVVDLAVVDERDLSVLADTGDAILTLLTCFPFDAPLPGGPLRFVVRAEALAGGEASAQRG